MSKSIATEAPPYSLTDVQENQTLTSQRTACINYCIIHPHGHTIMIEMILKICNFKKGIGIIEREKVCKN